MSAPEVDYRMTLRERRETEGRWGAREASASVFVRFVPDDAVDGLQFADALVAGSPMRPFAGAVHAGITSTAARARGGIAFTGVRAELLGGACGKAADPATAFAAAGGMAFAFAAEGNRQLLEPLVAVDVELPEADAAGWSALLGAVALRHGTVVDDTAQLQRGALVLHARMPSMELPAFERALRELSGGRGSCSARPAGYRPVYALLAQQVLWERDAFAAITRETKDRP